MLQNSHTDSHNSLSKTYLEQSKYHFAAAFSWDVANISLYQYYYPNPSRDRELSGQDNKNNALMTFLLSALQQSIKGLSYGIMPFAWGVRCLFQTVCSTYYAIMSLYDFCKERITGVKSSHKHTSIQKKKSCSGHCASQKGAHPTNFMFFLRKIFATDETLKEYAISVHTTKFTLEKRAEVYQNIPMIVNRLMELPSCDIIHQCDSIKHQEYLSQYAQEAESEIMTFIENYPNWMTAADIQATPFGYHPLGYRPSSQVYCQPSIDSAPVGTNKKKKKKRSQPNN